MAARFGDILLQRRRELGLSIQQVANIIKIRPQIIEFFETGDFRSMPPRGYAQGMIVSYARFLNLNPQEIVNLYFDELLEYESASGHTAGRFQSDAPYVSRRSEQATGRFTAIDGGRLGESGSYSSYDRNPRYAQRPPQAGYVTEAGTSEEIGAARDRLRNAAQPETRSVPRRSMDRGGDSRAGYGDGSSARRARAARAYDEDVAYRDEAPSRRQRRPYGNGGSNRSRNRGRNTDLRGQRGSRNGSRGGRRGRSRGLDLRFIIGIAAAVLLVLIIIVVFAVRGCTSSRPSDTTASKSESSLVSGSSAVSTSTDDTPSDTTDATDASADAASTDGATDGSTDDTASDGTDGNTDAAAQPIVYKVSVASKKTAWVEIKVDGKSVYAAQTTGPWEYEYTPNSAIEITTSKPSYVTVTKNDEKVRYDTKVSGVARISEAVEQPSSDDATDASADGTTDSAGDAAAQ